MVIVHELLNNFSYGPQSGVTFCTQWGGGGGGVVAVSKLTVVIEKKASKLSRFCHVYKV